MSAVKGEVCRGNVIEPLPVAKPVQPVAAIPFFRQIYTRFLLFLVNLVTIFKKIFKKIAFVFVQRTQVC